MFKLPINRNTLATNQKLREKFEKLHLGTAKYLNAKTGGWRKKQKSIFLSLILLGFSISITLILINFSNPTIKAPREKTRHPIVTVMPDSAQKIDGPSLPDTNHPFYHP